MILLVALSVSAVLFHNNHHNYNRSQTAETEQESIQGTSASLVSNNMYPSLYRRIFQIPAKKLVDKERSNSAKLIGCLLVLGQKVACPYSGTDVGLSRSQLTFSALLFHVFPCLFQVVLFKDSSPWILHLI